MSRLTGLPVLCAIVAAGCLHSPSPPPAPPPPPLPMVVPRTEPGEPAEPLAGRAFIWNGNAVQPGQHLEVVALGFNGRRLCMGTVVARRWVLTAEHCLWKHGDPSYVFIGHDVRSSQAGADSVRVYDSARFGAGSGLADRPVLLRLLRDVPPKVVPSAVADAKRLNESITGRVVGFGRYDRRDTPEKIGIKRSGMIPITSHDCGGHKAECAENAEMIAGGGQVDTCPGDSGGPLFVKGSGGEWLLAGITSRGVSTTAGFVCGQGGIYMRADIYASWITQKTR